MGPIFSLCQQAPYFSPHRVCPGWAQGCRTQPDLTLFTQGGNPLTQQTALAVVFLSLAGLLTPMVEVGGHPALGR